MISSKVIADSLSPQGDRLISILCTFPRFILAEVNTHRMLGKNTSSSRAIPFKKMLQAVQDNPFVPIAWQKDHPGMQGTEYLDTRGSEIAESAWLVARNKAIEQAWYLNTKDVTKQLANRLLEPFMWTTMVITGSLEGGWDNFFDLRCPQYKLHEGDDHKTYKSWKDAVIDYPAAENAFILDRLKLNKGLAEIHMMALAEAIYDSVQESTSKQLKAGDWHIPFIDQIDISTLSRELEPKINESITTGVDAHNYLTNVAVKVSTAMCARTSYTIVGEEKAVNYGDLIALDDRLLGQWPPHSSPMEHCARVMDFYEYNTSIKGSMQEVFIGRDKSYDISKEVKGWCRNYRGFIQRRHLIETKV